MTCGLGVIVGVMLLAGCSKPEAQLPSKHNAMPSAVDAGAPSQPTLAVTPPAGQSTRQPQDPAHPIQARPTHTVSAPGNTESMHAMQERRKAFWHARAEQQLLEQRVALHAGDSELQRIETELRQNVPAVKASFEALSDAEAQYRSTLAVVTTDYAVLTSNVARLQGEADRTAAVYRPGMVSDETAMNRVLAGLAAANRALRDAELKALAEQSDVQKMYQRVMDCRSAYERDLMACEPYRAAQERRQTIAGTISNLTVKERLTKLEH